MRARVAGAVILEATIDAQGKVVNLRVLRSVPLLNLRRPSMRFASGSSRRRA